MMKNAEEKGNGSFFTYRRSIYPSNDLHSSHIAIPS